MPISFVVVDRPEIARAHRMGDARWDLVQVFSGLGLALFLAFHTVLTASVVLSPRVLNAVAGGLEAVHLDTLAHWTVPVLFLVHFVAAARKVPFRWQEQRTLWAQARMLRHADTWAWAFQAVSGMAVLLLGVIHMWTTINAGPIEASASAARVQHGAWVVLYLLLAPLGQAHAVVGVYRAGVKWGFVVDQYRQKAVRYALYVLGGGLVLSLAALVRYATL
jgi:fumarate reductase subunit C